MKGSLCMWFGFLAGAWVGLSIGVLRYYDPPTGFPGMLPLMLDGLVVAVITVLLAAALASLMERLRFFPVVVLALLIGAPTGLLLGPLAYYLLYPLLGLVVCGILGFLLGLLICRLVCDETRSLKLAGIP